jgi:hypothetical protein
LIPVAALHYVHVRTRASALVAVVAVALTGGCTSHPVRHVSPRQLVGRPLSCPSAPFLLSTSAEDAQRPPLGGPAPGDVHAGRFIRTLALDHGAFTASPPRADDRAVFSGDTALCQVLASSLSNGADVGRLAASGLAAGLARVTVDDKLLGHTRLGNGVEMHGWIDGIAEVNPTTPAPRRYDDRLAWVVVVPDVESASCPAMLAGSTPPPRHVDPTLHGYAVFAVDAASGADALLYTERMNPICPGGVPQGPWVDVPLTSVSLPWHLESEQSDRSRGTVSFDVGACDGYSPVVLAGAVGPPDVVRVVVRRPFGALCPPPHHVVAKLRARAIGDLLPPDLKHAAVGPYVSTG